MNSKSQRKPPMFFKIILENTLTQGRLEIPSGFVKEFRNSLRNRVILKVPNGKAWQVEKSKVGQHLWLGKGWVEFSEHHSLKHGHLLVFKYEGNSQFNVLIFDKSAMEIDYPGTSRDTKYKELGGNLTRSSKVSTNIANFNSSNPWFQVDLKSINIRKKYLAVPYSFIEKHTERESKTVMFKVEDKSWSVKLNVYPKSRVSMFNTTVASFLRDNSVKTGDSCVFELNANNIFNVSIFRI